MSALNDCETLALVNQVAVPLADASDNETRSVSVTKPDVVSHSDCDELSTVTKDTITDVNTDCVTNNNDGDAIVEKRHDETDLMCADTLKLIKEKQDDPSLAKYFDMIKTGNKQFFVRDGILYRHGKVLSVVLRLC